MPSRLQSRFSSAHVMAALALFVSLGGTAWGISIAKNSVGTKQLKKNAVKTRKIAPNAVKTRKIAPGAVTGDKLGSSAVTTGKIAENAVSGAKVDEATLGQVPLAAKAALADKATAADDASHAGTADRVGNTEIVDVLFRSDTTASTAVFTGAGLTLTAGCTVADETTLTASTGSNNSVLHSYSVDTVATGEFDNVVSQFDFDVSESPLNLLPEDNADQVMTLQYISPGTLFVSSGVVTAILQIDQNGIFDCEVHGHVIRSGGDVLIL